MWLCCLKIGRQSKKKWKVVINVLIYTTKTGNKLISETYMFKSSNRVKRTPEDRISKYKLFNYDSHKNTNRIILDFVFSRFRDFWFTKELRVCSLSLCLVVQLSKREDTFSFLSVSLLIYDLVFYLYRY